MADKMKTYYEGVVQFKDRASLDANINTIVKRRLGNGVFVSSLGISSSKKFDMVLGIYVPKIIDNPKTNKRMIRFLKFDSVGILEVEKENGTFNVSLPKPDEVSKRLTNKMSKLVFGVESTLLETIYSKLVEIPVIQTSLNPIREILVYIYKNNEFRFTSLEKERGSRKASRYTSFLESLSLIKKINGVIQAGEKFNDIRVALREQNEKAFYNRLLADVLKNGYGYIREYLKLTAIIPYLRWSNSYYLPSAEIDELLLLDYKELSNNHHNIYGVYPEERKAQNQISRLADVGIFKEEENYFVGDKKVLNTTISTLGRLS